MPKDTLFAIGEALIDFIPHETGCDFSSVTSFSPKIGGAPANVLGAFAKLGGKTQLITQLGTDPFGQKIIRALSGYHIGTKYITLTNAANTALAFVSLDKTGDRTFSFYRNPSADMLYDAKNLKAEWFAPCFALHFCSVSLGETPMKAAHKRAIKYAKQHGALISFDPNIRLPLWKDTAALKKAVDEFLPFADIIKVSLEELPLVTGTSDIEQGCGMLLNHAKLVLCTCGALGSYAFTERFFVFAPSKQVDVKDTTGAGDAFCGSFLYSLYRSGTNLENLDHLSQQQLLGFIKCSNGYCEKSVQAYGAIESYPTVLK